MVGERQVADEVGLHHLIEQAPQRPVEQDQRGHFLPERLTAREAQGSWAAGLGPRPSGFDPLAITVVRECAERVLPSGVRFAEVVQVTPATTTASRSSSGSAG
ncbi:hypothetical protein [Micromonospora sp. U21]|uniref:hypothetical protein n=1 Tax=Micromonospora sp. U21 TaxID=2824899 RepID=UPI001B388FDF|nr:hypothetical protein [Micromonospora sp. U21]MBQ0905902.1 hypothetical protein [Micromonospora sp. U21]